MLVIFLLIRESDAIGPFELFFMTSRRKLPLRERPFNVLTDLITHIHTQRVNMFNGKTCAKLS